MGIFDSSAKKQQRQQLLEAEKKSKSFNQRLLRNAEREVKRSVRFSFDRDVARFVADQKNEIKYRKNAIKQNDKAIADLGRKKKWYER